MQDFKTLKAWNDLQDLSIRLKNMIDYGLVLHYNEYIDELHSTDKKWSEYVRDCSLVFDGIPRSAFGYSIVYRMSDEDPETIDSTYDDLFDGIVPRLFIDGDGYMGILVYNLDDDGNIIEDDYFCLCSFEYCLDNDVDDEDSDYDEE